MEGRRREWGRRTPRHECAQPDASPPGHQTGRRSPLSKREIEGKDVFQFDIWVLSTGDRKTRPVIHTAANEMTPEFSPDGRWLAYVSNESGRNEVYVQPYPGPGERTQISTKGGEQPVWSANGREMFYVQGGTYSGGGVTTLMSVKIATAPAFRAGTPEAVFESADLQSPWGRSYDVAKDGRFLLAVRKERETHLAPAQMILVQHWFEEAEAPRPDEIAFTRGLLSHERTCGKRASLAKRAETCLSAFHWRRVERVSE